VLAPLTLALALAATDAVGEGGVPTAISTPTSAALRHLAARGEPVEPRAISALAATALSPGRLALAGANAQDEYGWEGSDEEDGGPRLFITAWGGQAFDVGGGDGHSGSAFGGEVAYALDFGDLGLWASGYKIRNRGEAWAPIALLRLTNRFATGRGLDAAFTFGVGAGRPANWRIWFQVALGLRLDLGPMFLAGELAFEQDQLLRLSGGVGVKL
jgi:hypothetical protein